MILEILIASSAGHILFLSDVTMSKIFVLISLVLFLDVGLLNVSFELVGLGHATLIIRVVLDQTESDGASLLVMNRRNQ